MTLFRIFRHELLHEPQMELRERMISEAEGSALIAGRPSVVADVPGTEIVVRGLFDESFN